MTSKMGMELLVSHATELFCVRGYHYTSMTDLAKRCGVSKASIYHYIPSKRELALRVLQAIHLSLQEHVFCWAYQSHLSFGERLENFFNALEDYFKSHPTRTLINYFDYEVIEEAPEFTALIEIHFNEWIKALHMILSMQIPIQQAKRLAREIICLLQGELMLTRVVKATPSLHPIYERILCYLNESVR